MENQVLSIDQCKELVALGIDMSKASMEWIIYTTKEGVDDYTKEPYLVTKNEFGPGWYNRRLPTFTLQNILDILPKGSLYFNKTKFVTYMLDDDFIPIHEKSGNTSLEAAFNMLKWCKQNNYI